MDNLGLYYYSKEKIIKSLECDIKNYCEEINALQNIKRLRKKDGSDFKNLKQNFDDSLFIETTYGLELYVYGVEYYYSIQYDEITINKYSKIYIWHDIDYKNITPQAIEEAIKENIKKLENNKSRAEKTIKDIKNDEFPILNALETIKKEYKKLYDGDDKTLYYKLYQFLGYGG